MWGFDMKNLLGPQLPLGNLWIRKGRWCSFFFHLFFLIAAEKNLMWRVKKKKRWDNAKPRCIKSIKNKTDCQSISCDVAGHLQRAPPPYPLVSAAGQCTASRSHFTFTFNSPWLFAPTPPLPTGANCYDWWQASRLRVTCSSPRRFPAPRRHLQSCQPSRGPGPDRPHWRSCPHHRATRCRRTDGGISQVSTHSFFLALYSVYSKQNQTVFHSFKWFFSTPRECKDIGLLGALSPAFIFITVADGESQLVGDCCWWCFNTARSRRKLAEPATRACLDLLCSSSKNKK